MHALIAPMQFYGCEMTSAEPRFEARPSSQFGQNWCVYVIWPSGKTDELTGFANQHQALEWIKMKSANWAVDQILRGDV
jgi:hypothetical protein